MSKKHESLANFSPYNVDETAFDSLVRDPMQGVRDCMELGKTALKKISAMVASATIGMAPVAAIPFSDGPTRDPRVASLEIAHPAGVCPPESQVGIVQEAGLGMITTSVYASKIYGKILGDQYDECEAAILNGERYDPTTYAKLLHSFAEDNHFDVLILCAHSFGAIATVDTLNEYARIYPDSSVQFVVNFFSSPAGPQTLQMGTWWSAQVFANIKPSQPAVDTATYGGMFKQNISNLWNAQALSDARINADATPPHLVLDQSRRILKGMSKFSPEAAKMVKGMNYVGDERDEVVKNAQAPHDIEVASGYPMGRVYNVQVASGKLNFHADLWAVENIEAYRKVGLALMQDAQDVTGFRAKRPIVIMGRGSSSSVNRPI